MSFAEPFWLAGLPVLALLFGWRAWRPWRESVLWHSLADAPEARPPRPAARWKIWLPDTLLALACALALVALARPVVHSGRQEFQSEGRDLMLCLDLSGSMQAQDFKPNRFEAARQVALDFIAKRPDDRLGLVVFAGEAYTQCPLTLDHAMLASLVRDLELGALEDGTAVGLALATGVNRLEESKAKSRVLILLTDGVNNRGLDPRTALDLALTLGVKVYTVGVGKDGMAPIPVQTPFGPVVQQMQVEIDEELLREMAAKTGGRYFRARGGEELMEIYAEIDRLETSEITVKEYRLVDERWFAWLAAALSLLVASLAARALAGRLAA